MKENHKSEARQILDKFAKDLESFNLENISSKKASVASFRKEGEGKDCDIKFKTIMFKNAKHKNDMCLLLEKGSWN
jgi:hypothetical protein